MVIGYAADYARGVAERNQSASRAYLEHVGLAQFGELPKFPVIVLLTGILVETGSRRTTGAAIIQHGISFRNF